MNLFEQLYDNVILIEGFKEMREKYIAAYIANYPEAPADDIQEFTNQVKMYLDWFKEIKERGYKELVTDIGIAVPAEMSKRKGIDNYKDFEDLKKIVDYIRGQRASASDKKDTPPKSKEKTITPIFETDVFDIYQCIDKESCILTKLAISELPYEWCICRTDASNYFNVYRYKHDERNDYSQYVLDYEPTFYFVVVKDRLKKELEHWYNIPENTRKDNHSALQYKLNDTYHAVVIRIRADGDITDKTRRQYGFSSAANTGDIQLSWNDIISVEPRLAPLQALFKPIPLTKQQISNHQRFSRGLGDDAYASLTHEEKLAYIDVFPNPQINRCLLSFEQFKQTPDDLKNHYINQRIPLSLEQYKLIKDNPSLLKRYKHLVEQKVDAYIAQPNRNDNFSTTELMVLDMPKKIALVVLLGEDHLNNLFQIPMINLVELSKQIIDIKKENLASSTLQTMLYWIINNPQSSPHEREEDAKNIINYLEKYITLNYNTYKLLYGICEQLGHDLSLILWFLDKLVKQNNIKIADDLYIKIFSMLSNNIDWNNIDGNGEIRTKIFHQIFKERQNTVSLALSKQLLRLYTKPISQKEFKTFFTLINILLKQTKTFFIRNNGNIEETIFPFDQIIDTLYSVFARVLSFSTNPPYTVLYSKFVHKTLKKLQNLTMIVLYQSPRDIIQKILTQCPRNIRIEVINDIIQTYPKVLQIENIFQTMISYLPLYEGTEDVYKMLLTFFDIKPQFTTDDFIAILNYIGDSGVEQNNVVKQQFNTIYEKGLEKLSPDKINGYLIIHIIKNFSYNQKLKPIEILKKLIDKKPVVLDLLKHDGGDICQHVLCYTGSFGTEEMHIAANYLINLLGIDLTHYHIYSIFQYVHNVSIRLDMINAKKHLLKEIDIITILKNLESWDEKILDEIRRWVPNYVEILTRFITGYYRPSQQTTYLKALNAYVAKQQPQPEPQTPKQKRPRRVKTKPVEPEQPVQPQLPQQESLNVFDKMYENILLSEGFKEVREKYIKDYKTLNSYTDADSIKTFTDIVKHYLDLFKIIKNSGHQELYHDVPELAGVEVPIDKRNNIDSYKRFEDLKKVVDYIGSRRPISKGKKEEKPKNPKYPLIYEDEHIKIWFGENKEACILAREQMPLPYEWCVCRSDILNMYNNYRYGSGEPSFYFVQNKEKTAKEVEHWNNLPPKQRENTNISFANKIEDKWHTIVVQVLEDVQNARGYKYTSSVNDGDNLSDWENLIKIEPHLTDHKYLFKSIPLTDDERDNFKKYAYGLNDAEFNNLSYEEKATYIDIYPANNQTLSDYQFKICPDELKNHYINKGVALSNKQFDEIKGKNVLLKRYTEISKRKATEYIKFPNNFITFNDTQISVLDDNMCQQLFNKFSTNQISSLLSSSNSQKKDKFIKMILIGKKDNLDKNVIDVIIKRGAYQGGGWSQYITVESYLKTIFTMIDHLGVDAFEKDLNLGINKNEVYTFLDMIMAYMPNRNNNVLNFRALKSYNDFGQITMFNNIFNKIQEVYNNAHKPITDRAYTSLLIFTRYEQELADFTNNIVQKFLSKEKLELDSYHFGILLRTITSTPSLSTPENLEKLFNKIPTEALSGNLISTILRNYTNPKNRMLAALKIIERKNNQLDSKDIIAICFGIQRSEDVAVLLMKILDNAENKITSDELYNIQSNMSDSMSYDSAEKLIEKFISRLSTPIEAVFISRLLGLYNRYDTPTQKKWYMKWVPILLKQCEDKFLTSNNIIEGFLDTYRYWSDDSSPEIFIDSFLTEYTKRNLLIPTKIMSKFVSQSGDRVKMLKQIIDAQKNNINELMIINILETCGVYDKLLKIEAGIYIVQLKCKTLTNEEISKIQQYCFVYPAYLYNQPYQSDKKILTRLKILAQQILSCRPDYLYKHQLQPYTEIPVNPLNPPVESLNIFDKLYHNILIEKKYEHN